MDTEKKVQFVALTKEEIDAMIQQAALAGAQVASDAMMVGQRKSEKEKIDRRLHNTDLLLRNYRTLKASYENAVYKSKEGEVTEVLEHMVNDFISYIETSTVGYKTTMVRCVLRNGFEIIETSACVDARNYDQKLGEEICMKKIKDKIWYLLGFLLQTAWHGIK